MHPYFDEEVGLAPAGVAVRRELELHGARCLKAAKAAFAGGTTGVIFLCLWGLKPTEVAIPVFFAVLSLLCAAASAALFARLIRLQLASADDDAGEDDDRGWGGPYEPPDPPGPIGELEFDWQRFEREFRSYCERIQVCISS